MTTLYVTQPGTQVRKADERLIVARDDEVLDDIPLIKVDRLVLMGRGVSVTTPALHALTRRGVDIVFLTGRGRYVSRMVGGEHKHGRLRHAQALLVADSARALNIAGSVVRGKIGNQRVLVRRHAEGQAWARRALDGMQAMAGRVGAARTLDELRGLEGQAAKEYFGLLRRLLKPPAGGGAWGFERRAYYPPTDPINALLSFGYTLLLNDLIAACQLSGLDPYLGCFHAIDYGRPSMALDLEEEFRPVIVDSVVLEAANRNLIGLRDFERAAQTSSPGGTGDEDGQGAPAGPGRKRGTQALAVYLAPAARAQFIGLYEARVNEQAEYHLTGERTTYRRMFELQAQQMARVILGQAAEYRPMATR